MRILIDLQGNQNGSSRGRGIGRAALALTRAIIKNGKNHQVYVLLNASFEESYHAVLNELVDIIPEERILNFFSLKNTAAKDEKNIWRMRAAELNRERFINEFNPDAVLICSVFEGINDDTITSIGLLNSRAITAVVIHDLIPLLNQEYYLNSSEIWKNWYFEKINHVKRAELILTVSNSAAHEVIEHLGVSQSRVVTIGSGVAEEFNSNHVSSLDNKVKALLKKLRITRSFLMHASAFDQRKNFEGLIKAFADIPQLIRKDYQLVLVFKFSEHRGEVKKLYQLAKGLGLSRDDLILTGYVDDQELRTLYSLCYLFIFPSFHEGFGLPALEAMACGAAVVGSNITSIPEVIGKEDALFDPYSTESIKDIIVRALTDQIYWKSLKNNASERTKHFCWDKTANIAIKALEKAYEQSEHNKNYIVNEFDESLTGFAKKLAAIKSPVTASDQDYLDVAQSIYANSLLLNQVKAHAYYSGSIVWRVEGPFDSSYSLALVNREAARALKALGHTPVLHSTEGFGDFAANPIFLEKNPDLAKMHVLVDSHPESAVHISSRNIYPPRVADMHSPANVLHHYAWEESGFPQEWVKNFNEHLDGITCTSKHVEKVMIDNGVTVPLVNIGNGVDHWERITPSSTYRVNARNFKLLHVSTCLPRKGPISLLDGYGLAFTIEDDVTLIVKTTPNEHNKIHQWIEERRASNPQYPHVVVIEDDITDSELKALYTQCDVLVQPACAEGFGLPMAEAMLSGIPVITTGWSGQLEFCTNQTAWLVDYKFTSAKTHFELFFSAWAEVDVNDLAAKMKEVYTTPLNQRKAKAKLGRELLLNEFTWIKTSAKAITTVQKWQNKSKETILPKIGWLTTWNTRCGIATYSQHLINHLPNKENVIIYASPMDKPHPDDDLNTIRAWNGQNGPNNLQNVSNLMRNQDLNTLVIQFNGGLFGFDELGDFIEEQIARGLIVIVTMHSTNFYENFGEKLHKALSKCHRLLVHSIHDLNNLKAAWLVDNVALFPHGVLNYSLDVSSESVLCKNKIPMIATYGFCLPHKGLTEIIQAVALLKQQGFLVRLRMVNAEFSIPESSALISELRSLVKNFNIGDLVEFYNDFLSDEQSLELLNEADLLLFAYQNTEESASGAVRYGLATHKPVAVTPLKIFDDLGNAVFRFEGKSYTHIASGIKKILKDIQNDNNHMQSIRKAADRWRVSHDYEAVSQRLYNMCHALLRYRIVEKYSYAASSPEMGIDTGVVKGQLVSSQGREGRLLYGPFINLPSGSYNIKVHGIIRNIGSSIAYVDIVSEAGEKLLSLQSISKNSINDEIANLEFYSNKSINSLEVRVYIGNDVDIDISKIEIIPQVLSVKNVADRILTRKIRYQSGDPCIKLKTGYLENLSINSSYEAGKLCSLDFPLQAVGDYQLRVYGSFKNSDSSSARVEVINGYQLLTHNLLPAVNSDILADIDISIEDQNDKINAAIYVESDTNMKIHMIELIAKPQLIKYKYNGANSIFGSNVGRRDWAYIHSTFQEGYLIYGPYISIPKGSYKITIRGIARQIDSRAYIDVVGYKAEKVFNKISLNDANEIGILAELIINVEKTVDDLEMRVWIPDNADLSISEIQLVQFDEVSEVERNKSVSINRFLGNSIS